MICSGIDTATMMTSGMFMKLTELKATSWWKDSYDRRLAPTGSAQDTWMAKLAELVTRYQKRGIIWDIWNEPNWTGNFVTLDTPLHGEAVNKTGSEAKCQLYVDFVKRASEVIRSIHKYEWVAINSAGCDLEWYTACFERGLLNYVDLIMPHPYIPSFFNQPNKWDGSAYTGGAGTLAVYELILNFRVLQGIRASKALAIGEWGYRNDLDTVSLGQNPQKQFNEFFNLACFNQLSSLNFLLKGAIMKTNKLKEIKAAKTLDETWKLNPKLVEGICLAAKKIYPNEFISLISGDFKKSRDAGA